MNPPTKPVNKAALIYQTILDLTHRNRVVSRQVIRSITGFELTIIDDHIKSLVDKGKLRKVVNGVVEPVLEAPEDRAISGTWLPDGTFKLEVGDMCLDLTPREARAVGAITAGIGMQFGR